jgi:hypothetical protein
VLTLSALLTLASCGTPFTSAASPCDDQGGDCAVISGHVNQAGSSSHDAAAGEAGDATSQAGMPGDGGSPAATSTGGQGGDDGGNGGESAAPLPISCRDALERDPSLSDSNVTIDPDGSGPLSAFDAHCDMKSDGGGWTQIGIGEYWQSNDIDLKADAVLPWAEMTALLSHSAHVFRAGAGEQRLYLKDEGALVEMLNDEAGTDSDQSFMWRSTAPGLQCAKSYAALVTNTMLTVTTKEVSCEPLAFGKHMCGVAAGWLLLHRNDTPNWSGNPCAFPVATGGTPASPTNGALHPLWLR